MHVCLDLLYDDFVWGNHVMRCTYGGYDKFVWVVVLGGWLLDVVVYGGWKLLTSTFLLQFLKQQTS